MKPKSSTNPVPSVSIATVDRRKLPSRGRSFQKAANEGRPRAGQVTGRSMAKATDNGRTGSFNGLGRPARWLAELFWRQRLALGQRKRAPSRRTLLWGGRPTHEQEVGCAYRQGQVVRRREGFRLSQRRRGR